MINLEKTTQNEVKSSKRLEILKRSLEKKQSEFDNKLNSHISDVKRANGQPMNDYEKIIQSGLSKN